MYTIKIGDILYQSKERYSKSYYSIETPELIDEYQKVILLSKIDKINLSELKLETLKNICDICTSEAK